jgi:cytochrome oxidase Cu insertion factor (SCO1/SenC/PrrC family)
MTGRGGRGAPPLRRLLPWAVLAAAILAVTVTAVGSRRWGKAGGAAPPPLGEVPDFSLLNRDGRSVTRADLAGRPWIAGFVFTRCGGPCPRITAQMARLGRLLPHPELVRRVSVSVDPEFDTPAVLDAYAAERGIEDPRWYFLTGPRPEVYRLVRDGFKLAVGEEGGTAHEPILHSTRLVLVDGGGRIRGYYDALDEQAVGRLLDDVRALRRQGL